MLLLSVCMLDVWCRFVYVLLSHQKSCELDHLGYCHTFVVLSGGGDEQTWQQEVELPQQKIAEGRDRHSSSIHHSLRLRDKGLRNCEGSFISKVKLQATKS